MDQVLKAGELGNDGEYKLEVVGGDLVISVGYAKEGVGAGLHIKLSPDVFIDKLAEAIPGQIDDAILSILKAAIKSYKN